MPRSSLTGSAERGFVVAVGAAVCAFGLLLGLWPLLFDFFPNRPEPIAEDSAAIQVWSGIAYQRVTGMLIAGLGALAVGITQIPDAHARRLMATMLAVVAIPASAVAMMQAITIWDVFTWQGWLIVAALAALAGSMALVSFAAHRDLDRSRKLRDQQQASIEAQLREAAAQEERNRLARDLHDTIKQQLFSINVAAATAQSLQPHDPDGAAQHIQRVRNLSQAAMAEMKALLTQLRPQPLATVGLVGAIREQLEALHFRAEVETELRHDPLPDEGELPPGAQEAIFRTVQETLSNIARHARAKNVRVSLSREATDGRAQLQVSIQDDGQGFDPVTTQPGMGLSNMRARIAELGGALEVQSAPSRGTVVRFSVPLVQPADQLAQVRREKEERFQRVYWATSLLGFALVALIFAGIVALGFFVEINTHGRSELQGGLPVIGALGALVVAPLLIYSFNLRRRLRNDPSLSLIWLDLLHYYDTGQIFWVLLVAAWGCFSLRAFALAAAALIGSAIVLAINLRLYRRLDRHLEDWATPQLLRARRNEQLLFLGFALVFQIFVYAGVFGPMNDVRLFHDRLDSAWFASLLATAYPLVIVGSIPSLLLTQRQYSRLIAKEEADESLEPARVVSSELRRMRMLATGLTIVYALLTASVGALLIADLLPLAVVAAVMAAVVLGAKSRVERALTARVGEWSSLHAQQSALWTYTICLITAVIGIVGGIFGALLAISSPGAVASSTMTPASAMALFGSVTFYVATPLYLLLQTIATRRRIRILEASGATKA
ncbi:MAG: sensor histidine kinase [Anaerolineae bacterium]|nr:sensor histidine kinase [Candidatus Roseilinea sp.]MDW8450814.1 sensor histidine kinase [Anaerolineae bacterium]